MNFPKFWAKGSDTTTDTRGKPVSFSCWGWSNVSLDEARKLASETARRVAEKFASRHERPMRYAYGDRPLREQVLREFRNGSGELGAAITRNAYGCLVLNTARVMFVDIDIPELEESTPRFMRKLFGKPAPDDLVARALSRVEEWTSRNPGWGWRVYRTRAGVRLLATHDVFKPEAVVSNGLFDAVGADPLYRKLCANQKSFRARLTPKPWRIGLSQSPKPWPWENEGEEERFKTWDERYVSASSKWATCELQRTIGNASVHPEVTPIIKVHDELTRAESSIALA